jgi:hypothetical protein
VWTPKSNKSRSAKKSREATVVFRCSTCKVGFGLCRFRELRNGTVKSCICKKDEEYEAFQDRQVKKITPSNLRKMHDDRRVLGVPETCSKWGIRKSTLDHAMADKWRRLSRKPHNLQDQIYVRANTVGVDVAMAEHKLTHQEVVSICQIRQKRKAAEKAEAIAAWDAMPTERKSEIKRIIAEAKPMIRDAVEIATDGHEVQPFNWFEEGRYWGEFSTAEYSTCDRYSHFGWVAEVVSNLPVEFAASIFGSAVGKFVEIIQRTESGRAYRRKSFNKKKVKPATSTVKREKTPVAKRGLYFFPSMDGKSIASALTTYALAA